MRPTRARRILALATGLIVTVTLSGQTIATAQQSQASASTLSKNAVDITSPGHFPVEHGDVINWILSYAGNAGTGQATITDTIQSGQSFVPGSLKVPPGWSPSWSTDGGTTFQNTEPGSGVNAVQATNPQARPGGTNLAHFLLPPVQTTATPTGGDGYTPVIYRDQNGSVEAWNTYHHLGFASPKVVCTNLLTNQPCAGGPWPRPLNTTPVPLGAGSTGDIQSTLTPQYVTDPAHPERLYYAAVTAASAGVACLDMAARTNCGYFPLQNAVSGIGGIVAASGNLYGVSTTGQVLCLNLASLTPCAGQPYAAIVPADNNGGYYLGSLTVAGGKVFASASPGAGPQLGCFDPVAATPCAGWASPKPVAGNYTYAAFTSYDTGGNANGACVPAVSGGAPAVTCFALDGSPLAAPAGFGSVTSGALTFNPETVTLNGSLRSYFPFWGGSLAGGTGCYDWTAAAICAGFPFPKTHPNVNGGATRDYGYDYDETTQCLVGLGDAGYLFSIDPASGTSPCIHSGASVSLSPGAFYCDEAIHSQTYTKAQLENITLSNVDLANSSATVTGTGGAVLATVPFAADGSVDLSGILPAAHPTVTVNAQLTLLSTADFGGGNQPSIVISYQGDPPQVCFRTAISTACSVNYVSNTGNGSDPGGSLTSNPVTLPVSPGPGCQPVISLNKEICADTRASHCGPSGTGPWVKKSPAGLLGLLGTAYWRITVTNTGEVDAVQATLTDQVAPSCVTAAGTFTVPAHSTRQFFCSSTLLVLPLTNTASASFVAAGSPPGSQPTTTSPSSATACSLLCILLPGSRQQ